ncbi:MAG: alginate lyase family protein [Candidatus Hydrogenedentes bacterium]|nr:alginate lyase family protein [Candidatus Hydrogenedentota bacterium]
MHTILTAFLVAAVQWQHPAGLVTDATLAEVRDKLATQPWAQSVYDKQKSACQPWLDASSEDLRRVFPKVCGNVYHNFSCPTDRCRLTFDPFENQTFVCPICKKSFSPETNAGIYEPGDRYYGTMYDGWVCMFYQNAGITVTEMAVMAQIENDARYSTRAIEILMLFADTIEPLATRRDPDPQMSKLLTYHREGDNKVLYDLACAYELLRAAMTPDQRARFEKTVLQRMLDDLMLEPYYKYDHNNVYQWHRTIVQTALALEREDLIDWAFGFGAYSPEALPEHRSMRRLLATHFKPDGAFWEMCSGYHLYPLSHLCEFAVVSRNLSAMDPQRFPAAQYDLTAPDSEGGRVISAALHWFMSMAMPNRRMPTIGDSMAPLAGMDDYYVTAETGYRFFGVTEVGDYKALRDGNRNWVALLYGAPAIEKHDTPLASSYLSSGWVSLCSEWEGNAVWAGLNALIPGGGHQHADRLGLLIYSQDTLLALEKATPYNESTTRNLGTFSPMHNTVTVDMISQTQGEALKPEQVPEVALFHASDWVQFAELRADRLYPQASVYRRSVALIEDIIVDGFHVEGGATHDWTLQHAGPAPELSMATADSTFEPAEWLYNGSDRVRAGAGDAAWNARWHVGDVTSRLSMAGAADTTVYALETYPIDNAVITADFPACQTLCVRRTNDAPFFAVWDAWRSDPNMQELSFIGDGGVLLRTRSHTYHIRAGSGRTAFADECVIETDGDFAVVRDRDAAFAAGGALLNFESPEGNLRMQAAEKTTMSASHEAGTVRATAYPAISYDTCRGENQLREAPSLRVEVRGSLWKIE